MMNITSKFLTHDLITIVTLAKLLPLNTQQTLYKSTFSFLPIEYIAGHFSTYSVYNTQFSEIVCFRNTLNKSQKIIAKIFHKEVVILIRIRTTTKYLSCLHSHIINFLIISQTAMQWNFYFTNCLSLYSFILAQTTEISIIT